MTKIKSTDIIKSPANIRKTQRGGITAKITLPAAIVRRYNLKHGDELILAYLGKSEDVAFEMPREE